MLGLQYGFALPDEYDMTAVRRRVAEAAPRFDRLPGLAHKAFLCNDRSRPLDGVPATNQFAAFAVWDDAAAAGSFLTSELFRWLVDGFGRPHVRLIVALCLDVCDTTRPPAAAVHQVVAAGAGGAPDGLADAETAQHRRSLGQPGLYARVVALDPERWDIVRFSLWHAAAVPAAELKSGHGYELLHLATPLAGASAATAPPRL